MKKRILATLLSLCLVVGLLSVTALATEAQSMTADTQGISTSTYDVYTEKDFLHVLASFNSDSSERLNITVHDSFTLNKAIDISNVDIILNPNVTLTANAAIKINGNCSIKGVDTAVFDGSNVTMTTEPTAMIKRGANTMLFLVQRNATLSTSDVIIDGGAEWCADETCTDPGHIATADENHSQPVSGDENAMILAIIGRQIHNKGITSENTLIQVDGRFNGANIVFQNTAYDKVQGDGAVVYVNGNVYLTNTVMRNCQTARGRAVGFYGWGVLEITNFEAYGNMMEWGRGQNCGVIFTDWGFNLDLNGANIHNNACSREDRGIISGGGPSKFNSGKISNNYARAFHTHWGASFYMNGGEFSHNRCGIGYLGSSGAPAGYIYMNGGKIYNNTLNVFGHGLTRLYLNGGEINFADGDYCSGNIYFGGNDTPLIIRNPDMGERGFWPHDRIITGPLSEGSRITLTSFAENNYIRGLNYTISEKDFEKFINQTDKTLYLDKTTNTIYPGTATTITLDTNGGTCDVTTLNKYYPSYSGYNSQYGELPIPTKDGAYFAGWYTESDGGTLVTAASNIPKQAETTLYAHWTTNLAECTSATGYTGIFDGMAHSIQVITAEGATIQYSENEDGAYGEEKPEYTNVGTYTVYYKVNKEGCAEASGSATVIIERMDIGSWGQNRTYPYTGNELTRNTSSSFDEYFTISGIDRATEPGEYLMTCKVKDKYVGNIKWSVSNDSNGYEWTSAEGSAEGNYPTEDNRDTMVLRWAITGAMSEDETKEDVELSFEKGMENNTTSIDIPYANSATGAPDGSTISYSSNKSYVATVDGAGTVTPVSVGVVKITASYNGDETHNAASASYWLTITSDDQEDHFVIDQAYIAPTCEDVGYTEGKVCSACGQIFSGVELISAIGHDYQYTVSANMITGTCSHNAAHVITATLNAPSSADGEATVTYSEKWPEDAQNLAISYTTNGSNKTASITCNGQTASITYSVPAMPDNSPGNSSSSSSNTSTSTSKNPDGSTTTTTTNKSTGVTTETTKLSDGTTGTVVTDKNGVVTEVKASVSAKAAAEAAKTGEAVTLPVEVPAAKTTEDAPAVQVTVPKSAGSVKVEIPVEKVTPGTVAVIVKADGTEEIVKTSALGEDGVVLKLEGSATVKVIDNAKDFSDTNGHWAADYIDFVTARGMFSGTTETTFTPDAPMTRSMMWTVLARFDDEDISGGSVWYEKGMEWAKANGVSDGSNPDGSITREQLAMMLWRYSGSPVVEGGVDSFNDAGKVSDYASDAMRWAVETGLIGGIGNNTLAPQGNATRAQLATILMRYCENLME